MTIPASIGRSAKIGVGLLVAVLLLFVVLFSKDRIATTLLSGDTVTATFAEDYKLRPDVSVVKVGYVKVGKVSGVERDEEGRAVVSMKVDKEVLERLGSSPSATIRATTLLGGSYFVDLARGGDGGAFTARSIPLERTKVPVELDRVAGALQPDALDGLQGTLGSLDETLDAEGRQALKRLVASAPRTLDPAARVMEAAQGNDPKDLEHVVSGLESASDVLTRTDGQLDEVLADLGSTSRVLGGRSSAIASSVGGLPSTLDAADTGLADLGSTMEVLRDVADDTRPVARELATTLEKLGPVLDEARPVVRDARVLAADARPVLDGLVPAAGRADQVLGDLDGDVAKRLNGPVSSWLYEPYKGGGQYNQTSSKKTMYEEIVFTFVNLTRASSMADRNGHAVSFQPGIGSGSVNGLPVSVEQMFKGLTGWLWPEAPMNTIEPVTRPGSEGSVPGGSSVDTTSGAEPKELISDIQGLLGGLSGGR